MSERKLKAIIALLVISNLVVGYMAYHEAENNDPINQLADILYEATKKEDLRTLVLMYKKDDYTVEQVVNSMYDGFIGDKSAFGPVQQFGEIMFALAGNERGEKMVEDFFSSQRGKSLREIIDLMHTNYYQ